MWVKSEILKHKKRTPFNTTSTNTPLFFMWILRVVNDSGLKNADINAFQSGILKLREIEMLYLKT